MDTDARKGPWPPDPEPPERQAPAGLGVMIAVVACLVLAAILGWLLMGSALG